MCCQKVLWYQELRRQCQDQFQDSSCQLLPAMALKSRPKGDLRPTSVDQLFQRVAAILEQSRANIVRSINTNMVLAYWLIGREIVQELQGGR